MSCEKTLREKIKVISRSDLPMISEYKALLFYGACDGLPLSVNFDPSALRGKYVILKSIRLVPYNQSDQIDFYTDDGVNPPAIETIPGRVRINRIFDEFLNGAQIDLSINNIPSALFPTTPEGGYPADLFLDNLFYLFPEKIETFTLAITMQMCDNINVLNLSTPFIKVVMEVYIV